MKGCLCFSQGQGQLFLRTIIHKKMRESLLTSLSLKERISSAGWICLCLVLWLSTFCVLSFAKDMTACSLCLGLQLGDLYVFSHLPRNAARRSHGIQEPSGNASSPAPHTGAPSQLHTPTSSSFHLD